ncbi:uncharacterized protein LOC128886081 isoform X2 [Hylaeus anthracinus]|uniref:uncharacterized protein LOC128886081 isoform X2 n=1 Tax=Hylaeus anthracinus TaxID=313031 RepID=UPI0023B9CA92|nr:uncharacterized protein LOC128886081 isoform X2 [Hylaeus anthracinus]
MNPILRFTLFFIVLPVTIQESVKNTTCWCAVFPVGTSKSIIEHGFQFDTCYEQGEEDCRQLCIAVAKSMEARAPDIICENLITTMNLEVELYSKACNATAWKSTELKGKNRICCIEGISIPCTEDRESIDQSFRTALFA